MTLFTQRPNGYLLKLAPVSAFYKMPVSNASESFRLFLTAITKEKTKKPCPDGQEFHRPCKKFLTLFLRTGLPDLRLSVDQ